MATIHSFRLQIIVHSLTIDSPAKKFFVKLALEKGKEVETAKIKRNSSGNVVFFESEVELNYRPTSEIQPDLKIEVFEFIDDSVLRNGTCKISFNEFYQLEGKSEKEIPLLKCSDHNSRLLLSITYKDFREHTESFLNKIEGRIPSESSSSESEEDQVENVIEKADKKIEKIIEKADDKIEQILEKDDRKIQDLVYDADEKEEKIREKAEEKIRKAIKKGESYEDIEEIAEKAQEKIEKIEEKLDKKIEKIEEKEEKKIHKIEKKEEKEIEKVENKAEKEIEKIEEKKSEDTPPTKMTEQNANTRHMSIAESKSETKCNCILL